MSMKFSLAVGVDPGKTHVGIAVVAADEGADTLHLLWSDGYAVDPKFRDPSIRVRMLQQKFRWWRKYSAERALETARKGRSAFVVEKPLIFSKAVYITNDVSLTAGIALGVFSDSFFIPFVVPYNTWRKAFTRNADLTHVYFQLFGRMPKDDHERDAALLAHSFLTQKLWNKESGGEAETP